MVGSIALGLFSAALLAPAPAGAVSCQCFEAAADTQSNVAVPINGGNPYCAQVTSITDCSPKHFGLQSQRIESTSDFGFGTTYTTSCLSYRDNACKILVGSVADPRSIFNPCWTKDQCQAADGDFDDSGKDSPSCEPFAGQPTARCFVKPPLIKLQIPIPGLGDTVQGGFPEYLAAFYKFFVALLAVASVVMVMWGGFKRIMAVGSPEKIKDANDAIAGAITGLVLVLISYSLLALLNPRLVTSTRLTLDKVKTQLFGNWCPATDPTNKNIQYQCGDKATIEGQACVGSACPISGTGCYKVSDSGGVDSTGRFTDYQCLTPEDACNSVLRGTALRIHGAKDNYSGYQAVCSSFNRSIAGQQYLCLWQGGAEKCQWYTPANIAQVCADHSGCSAFSAGGNLKGFCTFDLCNRGCKIDGAACKP